MKRILLLVVLLYTNITGYTQTDVFWRAEPLTGSWDFGSLCTSSGSDGNWIYSSGGNRKRPDCESQQNRIYFGNNNQTTMNLNSADDYSIRWLIFNSSSSNSRTINTDNSKKIIFRGSNAKIENNSSATHTFNINIDANDPLELNPINGNLVFNNPISLNFIASISVYGSNNKTLTLTNTITGNGGFTIHQNSTVVFAGGAKSYNGNTTVSSGTLKISSNQTLNNLSVLSGSTLIVDAGVTLTINGTFTGGGTITNNGRIVLASDGSFPGSTTTITPGFKNLGINAIITINKQLDINDSLSFGASGKTLNTGNLITFKSSGIIVGRLGAVINGNVISGNVTVERHIPLSRRSFRQLSSGVNSTNNIRTNWQINGATTAGLGIHITGSTTGANGFDATQTGAASMFTYTAGASGFTAILGTDGTNKLDALRGYRVFVIGDRNANLTILNNTGANTPNIAMNAATTLSATGTLITGPVNYSTAGVAVNGTVTDATNSLSNTIGSFALIANPYWSPVDFDLVSKTNIASTYWMWNPFQGDRGGYVSYTVGTGPTGGNISKEIQPGQSIFIQTNAAGPSITFNETNKSTGFTNTFRTPTETPSKVRVQLYTNTSLNNGGYMQDGTVVAFRDDFSSAVGAEDAAKFTNPDENIAIVRGTSVLGLEGRSTVVNNDTIPVRIWKLNSNYNYTLKLEGLDFDPGITGVLVDKYLNQQHVLNLSGSINLPFTFNADSASFYDRFMLVFRPASTLPVTFTSIQAYRKNAAITVEWKTNNENNIRRYDVERSADGRSFIVAGTVSATNGSSNNYQWLDASPFSGNNYYRVKAISHSGQFNYTSVIRIQANAILPVISVYPNPVKGGIVTLKLEGLVAGKYSIQVFNALGLQVAEMSIATAGGSLTKNIRVGQLAKGQYTLLVQGENGISSTEKLIIE